MADVAHKHHFIPKFLLSNFTVSGIEDDSLWVTDRKERKGYFSKPCNCGFQNDFYQVNLLRCANLRGSSVVVCAIITDRHGAT